MSTLHTCTVKNHHASNTHIKKVPLRQKSAGFEVLEKIFWPTFLSGFCDKHLPAKFWWGVHFETRSSTGSSSGSMSQWGHSFFSLLSYCWASKGLGLPNISSAIKALYSCSKGAQHFSVSSTPKDVQTVYQGWYLMIMYSDNWTKSFKIE